LPDTGFFHGKNGGRLVVVGPINLPVGRLFVEEVITECRKRGASRVDVLAFEFEMGLFPAVLDEAKQKGIDLARPLYLQTYGEWTKKEGLARVTPGRPGAEVLLWDDARFFVTRARNTDTWVYTRQTFRDFPDYFVGDRGFTAPRRLTNANPQQAEYAWSSGAKLVDYVSDKGDTLQGALFLPAAYEPGKRYPTMVYIYEKLSQGLHQYALPNETRAFNPRTWVTSTRTAPGPWPMM